jgi:hypothetical protein
MAAENPNLKFRPSGAPMARKGMTAKDMEVGEVYSRPNGRVAIKFPDGVLAEYGDRETALYNYDSWLQEQQIQSDVDAVKSGTREFLSKLPSVISEPIATGLSEGKLGLRQMGQGARNMTRATSMAIPIIEGDLTGPRVTTPAMRSLQGSAQLGAGILRTSSALTAAPVGEAVDQLLQAVLTTLGMSPERARVVGGVGNVGSQLITPGAVPKVPLGRLRNLPLIRRLIKDNMDPVERAVRSTFLDEFGTKFPPRRDAFIFKENFGIELNKLDRGRSEAVTSMIREAEDMIPPNAFRDPTNTRSAILSIIRPGSVRTPSPRGRRTVSERIRPDEPTQTTVTQAQQDVGRSESVRTRFEEGEEFERIESVTQDTGINAPFAAGRVRGAAEREASALRRTIGGLSKREVDQLTELGINPDLLQDFTENQVDFFTLNQLRRDVGDALSSAKKARVLSRSEEAQLSNIYSAIRKDMNSFSDEFPEAVDQYNKGLQRFRDEVVPIRRFTKPYLNSQISDRILSAPAEYVRELRKTMTQEQARNLAAASFGSKMDTAFGADGVFNVGTFRTRIDTEAHRRSMYELLSPQEYESFKAMNDVLQQAAKDIAVTARIGTLMRPMALVHMVKGSFSSGGAFVIPEILKQSGRAQGARRILAAAKKQPFKPKFEAVRSIFATLEATRRQLAEERRFLAESSGKAVEPGGVEQALSIVGQQRPQIAQPPGAGQ